MCLLLVVRLRVVRLTRMLEQQIPELGLGADDRVRRRSRVQTLDEPPTMKRKKVQTPSVIRSLLLLIEICIYIYICALFSFSQYFRKCYTLLHYVFINCKT